MTPQEREVLELLGGVFGKFMSLSQDRDQGGHPDDMSDFRFYIHALQNMISARCGLREYLKCIVSPFSSRMCELGTKCCEVRHNKDKK